MSYCKQKVTTDSQIVKEEDYEAYKGKSLRSFLAFSKEANFYTQDRIVSEYQEWVEEKLYLSMQLRKTEISKHGTENTELSYFFSLASKRGNDVYAKRTLARYNETSEKIPKEDYFSPDNKKELKKTNALFITLTYSPEISSKSEAWLSLGKDFNNFLSKLRQEYDTGISQIRSWESQASGYPHIHTLVFFRDRQFLAHWHSSKNPNWRISRAEKDTISGLWAGGFTDIIAVYSPKKAFNYLGKYLHKYLTSDSSKAILTRALTWFYRKRAFSLSTALSPDLNTVSITQIRHLVQISLDGEILTEREITVLGCMVIEQKNCKDAQKYMKWKERDLPGPIREVVNELENRLMEKLGFGKENFRKIQTNSVISLSQLKELM